MTDVSELFERYQNAVKRIAVIVRQPPYNQTVNMDTANISNNTPNTVLLSWFDFSRNELIHIVLPKFLFTCSPDELREWMKKAADEKEAQDRRFEEKVKEIEEKKERDLYNRLKIKFGD